MPETWLNAYMAAMERWDKARKAADQARMQKAADAEAKAVAADNALADVEKIRQAMVGDLLEMLRNAVKPPSEMTFRDAMRRAVAMDLWVKRVEDLEADVKDLVSVVAKLAIKAGV